MLVNSNIIFIEFYKKSTNADKNQLIETNLWSNSLKIFFIFKQFQASRDISKAAASYLQRYF